MNEKGILCLKFSGTLTEVLRDASNWTHNFKGVVTVYTVDLQHDNEYSEWDLRIFYTP